MMQGNMRDVLGGDGEDTVEDEAQCFRSTDSAVLLRLDNKVSDDMPRANFPSAIALGSNRVSNSIPLLATGWTREGASKVICRGKAVEMAGSKREPFGDFFFSLDCTRDARCIRGKLSLVQADFGVKNCCARDCSVWNRSCDQERKTAFIHQFTIGVCPKFFNEADCHSMMLKPYCTAEVFGLQRNSGSNFQLSSSPSVARQFGTTVSHTAPAFGFGPTRRIEDTNAAVLIWAVNRSTNGTELKLNKSRWGSRPRLAILPDRMHLHPESFVAEVEWELHPHAKLQRRLQLQHLEFDVKINLHTAVLERKRLPGYALTTGPIVSFDRVLAFNK